MSCQRDVKNINFELEERGRRHEEVMKRLEHAGSSEVQKGVETVRYMVMGD